MDSSASSKRKLLPCIPDVPYHIQLVFIITFGYIWVTAFKDNYLEVPSKEQEFEVHKYNWWRGIVSCILFLCAFSYLRPNNLDFFHPVQRFWRVISMISLIYFCFVIVMLNHRPEYGRNILGYLDTRLNQEVTPGMHTYDDNCEFTAANVWDNFDHYYLVHLGNWFLSSFVIRDFWILHFKHLLDEVIELSWQHILPHFRECWWDHILMDIMLSNIPAITVGLWIIKRNGLQLYDYFGKEGKKSFFEYEIWSCHKRFGIMFYQMWLLVIHFLTGFFINNNLLIPPVHPFPVIRLLIWFGLGSIAFREGFEDARTWNTPQRKFTPVEGRYRWLCTAVLLTESLMCWKYRFNTGHINFDAETPFYIWGPWVGSFVFGTAYWFYLRFKPGHTTKYPIDQNQKKYKLKDN